MKIRVAVLDALHDAGPVPWVLQLAELEVVRELSTLEEAMAVSQAGLVQAVIFTGRDHELTATLVDRFDALGCLVLLLGVDPAELARLTALGALPLSARAEASQVRETLENALSRRGMNAGSPGPESSHSSSAAHRRWFRPAGSQEPISAAARPELGLDAENQGEGENGRHPVPEHPGGHQKSGLPASAQQGIQSQMADRGRSRAADPARSRSTRRQRPPDPAQPSNGPQHSGPAQPPGQPPGLPASGLAEEDAGGRAQPPPRGDGSLPDSDTPAGRAAGATDPRWPRGITAVWGPLGSPGRTAIATNFAAELALGGASVIVVDADTYGASIASVLGLLDESATIAQACRLADVGTLNRESLERALVPVAVKGAELKLLTGLIRSERWSELRGSALGEVLKLCGRVADYVVVDIGFSLEAEEELSFDTLAPRRNGAALTTLAAADAVLAVGEADPVAVPRMVRALPRLLELAPQAEVVVLMNKLRAENIGHFPERQIRQAWDRFAPPVGIRTFVPFEPGVFDTARREGQVLAEAASGSQARAQLRELICASDQRVSRSPVLSTTTRRRRSR